MFPLPTRSLFQGCVHPGSTSTVHRILDLLFLLVLLVGLLVFALGFDRLVGYVGGWALPVSPGCLVDVPGVLAWASVFVPLCLAFLSMFGVGNVGKCLVRGNSICKLCYFLFLSAAIVPQPSWCTRLSLCMKCPPYMLNEERMSPLPVHDQN